MNAIAPAAKPSSVSNGYLPNIDLRKFVQVLLSPEVCGNKDKAAMISGVSDGKFYYALKKPEFLAWFSEECKRLYSGYEPVTANALMSNIVKGDDQAIRTFYEIIGRIKKNVERSNTNLQVNNVICPSHWGNGVAPAVGLGSVRNGSENGSAERAARDPA